MGQIQETIKDEAFEEEVNDQIYVFYKFKERLPTFEEVVFEVKHSTTPSRNLNKQQYNIINKVLNETEVWLNNKKK